MIPPLAQYVSIMSKRLGHTKGDYKKWEGWERDYLRNHYPTKGRMHCSKQLKRTAASVKKMVSRMGLMLRAT